MNVDKAQLTAAANYLVQIREYVSQVKEIAEIIQQWEQRHVFFVGERECLNALISLGLQFPEKLTDLYRIIDKKRKEMPEVRRNEYQREFMNRMRARVAKALEIEVLVNGRRLTPLEKKRKEAALREDWNRRKEAFMETKGELDWKGRNAAIAEFWNGVDEELDKMLTEARQVLDRPPVERKRKRVVKVPPKPPANRVLYDALQNRKKS